VTLSERDIQRPIAHDLAAPDAQEMDPYSVAHASVLRFLCGTCDGDDVHEIARRIMDRVFTGGSGRCELRIEAGRAMQR
jgi:hypothetical protein